MKILIFALNSKFIHSSLAPWYLKAAIEKGTDTKVKVVEGTINESEDELISRILHNEFDLIGFSTYIWNKKLVLLLAKKVKQYKPGVKVVLGGPEVSYNAKTILEENFFVDFIISGEGEEPFEQIAKDVPYEEIDGLSFRKNGTIVIKPPHVSKFDPLFPYTDEYLKALNNRIAYIETSRGCPFNCAFCLSGRCGGVRFFDLDESKRKILLLANSGTQTVKFIDRTFNANKKRAIELFEFIIDNYNDGNIPPSVCFHFEIEGELVDEDTINVLKTSPNGLFQFEIGLQSFNEKTLEYINRKTNLNKLTSAIKEIISLGNIHVHIDLIAGMSYESYESFKNSFNEAILLRPHMLQLGFLKLLHGAEMREDTKKFQFEYSSEPPYEVISTEWMTKDELKQLHLFENIFEKIYNSARFRNTCEYIFSSTENVFESIMDFAQFCDREKVKNTLDDFTLAMMNYFGGQLYINRRELRDYLAIDRLSTNKMGTLPEFLKIHSPIIKKMLCELEKDKVTRREKNVKRSATILPSMNKFIYVDYKNIDKVQKSYRINEVFINFDEF